MSKMAYPVYTMGMVIFSSDPKNFTCHICPEKSQKSMEEHLQDQLHSLRLSYFPRYFEDHGLSSNFTHCKICKKWLPLDEVIDHAITHEFFPWFHSDDEFVTDKKKNKEFEEDTKTAKIYQLACDKKFSINVDHNWNEQSDIIITFCRICKAEVDVDNVKSHLDLHKKISSNKINSESNDEADLNVINENINMIEQSLIHLTLDGDDENIATPPKTIVPGKRKGPTEIKTENNASEQTGEFNDSNITESSMSKPTSSDANDNKSNDYLDLPDGIMKKGNNLYCDYCEVVTGDSYQSAIDHAKGKKHGKRCQVVCNGIIRIQKKEYKCAFCSCTVIGLDGVERHVTTVKHRKNSGVTREAVNLYTMAVSKIDDDLPDGFVKKENTFYCEPCNVDFPSYRTAVDHANSSSHEKRVTLFPRGITRIDKTLHECIFCNCTFKNLSEAEKHLESIEHEVNFKLNTEKTNSTTKSIHEVNQKSHELELPDGYKKKWSVIFCTLCKVEVGAYANIIEHSNSREHNIYNNSSITGITRVSSKTSNCNFCKCTLIGFDEVEEHLKSAEHKKKSCQVTMPFINKISEKLKYDLCLSDGFIEKGSTLFCECCSVEFLALESAIEHSNSIQHKKCRDAFQKGIIRYEEKLHKCTLCNYIINGLEGVAMHLESNEHKKKVHASTRLEQSTLVDNTFNESAVSTISSASSMSSPENSSSASSNNSTFLTNTKNETSTAEHISEFVGQPLMKVQSAVPIQPRASRSANPIEVAFINCNICNWVILCNPANILRHTASEKHRIQLQLLGSRVRDTNISKDSIMSYINHTRYFMIEFNIEGDVNLGKIMMVPLVNTNNARQWFYWCNICDSMFHESPNMHLRSISHLQIFHGIRTYVGSPYLICRICNNMTFISPGGVIDHINRPVHQRNLLGICPSKIKTAKISFQSIESFFARKNLPDGIEAIVDEVLFFCTICNCRLSGLSSVQEHVNDTMHKAKGKTFILRIRDTLFACLICSGFLANLESLERHVLDPTHVEKCKVLDTMCLNVLDPMNLVADLLKPIKMHEQNEYSCSMCHIWIEGDVMTALEHTLHPVHQSILINQNLNTFELKVKSIKTSSSHNIINEKRPIIPQMISTFKISPENTAVPIPPGFGPIDEVPQVTMLPSGIEQSVCNICNKIILGGHWNLMAHRDTKQHQENEAKLKFILPISACQVDRIEASFSQPPPFKDIPHEEIMQIHYKDMVIDSIECKICGIHIREGQSVSVNQNYADHMKTEEHEAKEVEFIKNWKPKLSSIKEAFTKEASKKLYKVDKILDLHMILCPFCGRKFEFSYQIHAHLTSHIWSRFVKNSSMEIPDNAENEDSKTWSQQTKVFEDVEFTSKPDKYLGKSRNHGWHQRPLDINIEDNVDIYAMNKQKKEDLQLSILLIVATDQENLYCLICRRAIKNSVQTFYEHLCSINHLDYLQQMIEDHRLFRDYPNELSDLALGYEFMEQVNDLSVKCHACKSSLPNDTLSLTQHMKDVSHVSHCADLVANVRTWFNTLTSRMHCDFYSVQIYWCVPCKLRFSREIEFRKHLYSRKHSKVMAQFENINEEFIFDHCAVCAALWFGFLRTFGYHSMCAMHKHFSSQPFYLVSRLPISAEKFLHSPMENINRLLEKRDNLQAKNSVKEKELLHDLETICKEKYPSCLVHPFGSRISGLGSTTSDLDVFVDCSTKKYPVYEGQNSSLKKIEERLKAIKSCLEENSKVWLIDCEILDARIPIIKVLHWPTGIQCDISFTNGLTVENTKLIKNYCEKFPNCRKMIIFIKNYMGHCELTGHYGMTTYGVVWMVIFFLQMKGILPSVSELIDKKKESRLIGGWETGVDLDFEVIDIGEQLDKLLADFFTFYANFDYRNDVICPLLGRIIKKTDFQKKVQLPIEMKLYLRYLESNKNPEPFRIDSTLCIQDPFDLSHNVAKAVKKFFVYKLKVFYSLSAQILRNCQVLEL